MCRNNFKISFSTAHRLQPLKKDPTGDIVKDITVLGKLAFCKLSAASFFGEEITFSRTQGYFSRIYLKGREQV